MDAQFIKICGITTLEDAFAAVESGASAVGFNFYPESKRYISPQRAAEISDKLPHAVQRVGVFVNATKANVEAVRNEVQLDMLQFHGDELPETISGYDIPVIKAVRIANVQQSQRGFQLDALAHFSVDAFLLDSFSSNEFGGTGKTFDWNIARQAKTLGNIILSGGLTPENVEEAIAFVQPFGVDVSSGVETSPGMKDHVKVEQFISRARKGFAVQKNLKRTTAFPQ
jgi:phosphoribosylanthranilate isomerase